MKSKRPFLHFYNLVGFMVKVNLIRRDKSLTQHCPEVVQGARARRKGLGGPQGGAAGTPRSLAGLLSPPRLSLLQGFIRTDPPDGLKFQ